jgi:hypothetical protein
MRARKARRAGRMFRIQKNYKNLVNPVQKDFRRLSSYHFKLLRLPYMINKIVLYNKQQSLTILKICDLMAIGQGLFER